MKFRRLLCVIPVLLFFAAGLPSAGAQPYAAAAQEDEAAQLREIYSEQFKSSGADGLVDVLDDSTLELLEELGISSPDFENMMKVSPLSLLNMFIDIFSGKLKNPLKIFGEVLFAVLMCALADCFKTSFGRKASDGLFSVISTVTVGLLLIEPLTQCMTRVCSAIVLSSRFMLVFIPVVTVLLTAAGRPITASGLNVTVLAVTQIISQFSSSLLVPMLCIYLAFSIVGALSPEINLNAIAETMKKTVNFILGLCSTVFVSMLSLQGMMSKSADSVASKTAKYLLSSFIPVVGGAIGDTIGTVQGCIGLTKNTVGAFGVVALILIYIPVSAELLLLISAVRLSGACSGLFGLSSMSGALNAVSYTLSLLWSVLLFCAVLFIVSTGVTAAIGGAG